MLALENVEAGNAEGLTYMEILEALRGVPLLRTDRNGWIEESSDGERMWAEVEK